MDPHDGPAPSSGSVDRREDMKKARHPEDTQHINKRKDRQPSSLVAQHYNARPDAGIDLRRRSPIFRLKAFNNWIKDGLIDRYARRRSTALDLCCGKGGDLRKWRRRAIDVVGIDIAELSVQQARERYISSFQSIHAEFYCADCFSPEINTILSGKTFDIVSLQFSLHYSFETESRARQAMINIASHLRKGGHFIGTIPDANFIYKRLLRSDALSFGNDIYKIAFETKMPSVYGHKYVFSLVDAIDDCPEYLINRVTLVRLAEEQGMKLMYWKSFHQIYVEEGQERVENLSHMGIFDETGTLNDSEWEAIGIYVAFAFQKI